MMNANIVNNPAVRMILLESGEKSGLRRKITGRGKLKAAVEKTGLAEGTIKRAIMGFPVKEPTAIKLRNYLNSQPCTSPSNAVSNR
ncbi:hypothetical protein [Chitinophaga sp.]|uniref:hypothetical protein n=1 Tax=Chitinophaga sp. TaxID=1869181 RepID=UPI0031DAF574